MVLVYVLDEVSRGIRPLGSASWWWLHHSLAASAPLMPRRGPDEEVIPVLVDETDAGAVFWNRRCGASREIDARLKQRLRDDGHEATSFHANLLFASLHAVLPGGARAGRARCGEYVRRWVPEVGTPDYPEPIVDLAASPAEALAAYQRMTGGGA